MTSPRPICLLAIVLLGCSRGQEPASSTGDVFLACAELPGLAQTHHQGLQNELALLRAEQATPKLLSERIAAAANPPAADLRTALDASFNPSSRKYASGRVDKLFDGSKFAWDPINLERAFRLRRDYDPQRLSIRTALVERDAQLRVPLSRGVGIDLQFVDAARLYNRLEMFQAAEQLTEGDLPAAIDTLAAMLTLAERLGQPPHVVTRMAAGQARREAWQILQAIVSHTGVTDSQLEQLHGLVDGQLAHWPADAESWIGDRAVGLHMYEMIREGHLLSILTEDELAQLQQEGTLAAFAAATGRSLDDDEYFYLAAMRKIVDACALPFPQRRKVFDQLKSDLNKLRDTPNYPLVADRLLLQGIEEAQRQQAADHAWTQAWATALSIAVDNPSGPPAVNPLSGQEYQVRIDGRQLTIARIDPRELDAEIVVPLPAAQRVSVRNVQRK